MTYQYIVKLYLYAGPLPSTVSTANQTRIFNTCRFINNHVANSAYIISLIMLSFTSKFLMLLIIVLLSNLGVIVNIYFSIKFIAPFLSMEHLSSFWIWRSCFFGRDQLAYTRANECGLVDKTNLKTRAAVNGHGWLSSWFISILYSLI